MNHQKIVGFEDVRFQVCATLESGARLAVHEAKNTNEAVMLAYVLDEYLKTGGILCSTGHDQRVEITTQVVAGQATAGFVGKLATMAVVVRIP